MIKLNNICKSFGQLQVLRNINLEINPGVLTAIVGPSGAGKTTLLQILGTLDRADSGEVIFDGQNVATLSDKRQSKFRNKNLGFVFQFHQLIDEFSAIENVALPALIGGCSSRKSKEKASGLLTRLGLGDRLKHKPAEMSGGERQRTAIARAIINDPKLILADEPTGSLDSFNRDEIVKLLVDLCETYGHTVVIVTHDEKVAAAASCVIRMEDGKILDIMYRDKIEKTIPSDLA